MRRSLAHEIYVREGYVPCGCGSNTYSHPTELQDGTRSGQEGAGSIFPHRLQALRSTRRRGRRISIQLFKSQGLLRKSTSDSQLSIQVPTTKRFLDSNSPSPAMLYLHRSFFAQAMLDHPSNPLLSPFAPSFLTAYRCASIIVKASVHQFDRCAEMAMRVWFLMCHTFSAAVRSPFLSADVC
jgi:hypothetical protein